MRLLGGTLRKILLMIVLPVAVAVVLFGVLCGVMLWRSNAKNRNALF
jgi:hypothetical protein